MSKPAPSRRRPIAADDVPRIFDQACIRRLKAISKLPSDADLDAFGRGIRDAAAIYAQIAATPTANELHNQIAELHRAARKKLYEEASFLLTNLSPAARRLLTRRAARLSFDICLPSPEWLADEGRREPARVAIEMLCYRRDSGPHYARDAVTPTANELDHEIAELHRAARDALYDDLSVLLTNLSPAARRLLSQRSARRSSGIIVPLPEQLAAEGQRQDACETIEMLCTMGGELAVGRRRPSGRRSLSRKVLLYAPKPRRHLPRRQAERDFVMWVRIAWLEATGERPSLTAHPYRPGPFAKLIKECLCLVGAPFANHVQIINDLHRERRRRAAAAAD